VAAPIACEGVPRELGFAQGRARRGWLRAWLGRAPWPAPDDVRRLDRDLWRHHPQLAERTGGLALGAGVSRRALVAALARPGGPIAPASLAGPALALEDARGGPLVVALVHPPLGAEDALVLRSARPDAGLAALEATLAWLAPGLAGVNEAGLAVAASAETRAPGAGDACRVPALALVTDCLQRFASADAAVEWCLRRPAGGVATLVAADASGRVVGASVAGDARRALAPEGGLLVGSGPEPLRAELAKAVRATPVRDVPDLAAALLPVAPGATAIWLDPARRRAGVGVLALGAAPEWIGLAGR
jgi:hypothetical protein